MAAALTPGAVVPPSGTAAPRQRRRASTSRASAEAAADAIAASAAPKSARKETYEPLSAGGDAPVEEVVAEAIHGNYPAGGQEGESRQRRRWLPLLFGSRRERRTSLREKGAPSRKWFMSDVIQHPMVSMLTTLVVAGFLTHIFISWNEGGRNVDHLEGQVHSMVQKVQVQIDAANSVMNGLKVRMEKQEKAASAEFEKLGVRVARVENSLEKNNARLDKFAQRLEGFDPLLKETIANALPNVKKEIMELVDVAMTERALQGLSEKVTLEDVRKLARSLLEEQFERRAADDVGLPDYALASGGARLLGHSEVVETKRLTLYKLGLGAILGQSHLHPSASKVVQRSAGVPGECLPLKGSNGTIDIALRTTIIATAVTLEHVAESVSFEMRSAPKDVEVLGWRQHSKVEGPEGRVLLAKFSYSIKGRRVQTFPVTEGARREAIGAVRLRVLSNHGSPTHTCIYRFRVHGNPVGEQQQQPDHMETLPSA